MRKGGHKPLPYSTAKDKWISCFQKTRGIITTSLRWKIRRMSYKRGVFKKDLCISRINLYEHYNK
ncbi:MAG: hypothetical protein OIN88_02795 [Candidatus Methanoperedens sp.]|nr:hypothetical protein [Candidatus Methanoperedens sp.]MCZ7358520.1 hypothetical protein [Candidatus Methanoperedens sp.]HLB71364.1 hypothetical protein [Candidatus Methanoperedens sp.]